MEVKHTLIHAHTPRALRLISIRIQRTHTLTFLDVFFQLSLWILLSLSRSLSPILDCTWPDRAWIAGRGRKVFYFIFCYIFPFLFPAVAVADE